MIFVRIAITYKSRFEQSQGQRDLKVCVLPRNEKLIFALTNRAMPMREHSMLNATRETSWLLRLIA